MSNRMILHKIKVKIQAHFVQVHTLHIHMCCFFNWWSSQAFVLAHELGHAGHFTLAKKHQQYLESEASMYLWSPLLQ